NGGPGTVYLEGPSHIDEQGDLYVVDDGVMTNLSTPVAGYGTTFDSLETGGAAMVEYDSSTPLNLSDLTVDDASILALRTVFVSNTTQIVNGGSLRPPFTTTSEIKPLHLTSGTLFIDENSEINGD